MTRRPFRGYVCALGLVLAVPAVAQQELLNPNFDANALSWEAQGVNATIGWDGSLGSPSPGAGLMTKSSGSAPAIVRQCLPTQPGRHYGFGALCRIPPLQPGSGQQCRVTVQFYGESGCNGLLSTFLAGWNDSSVWTLSTGAGAIAPLGAHSVALNFETSGTQLAFDANFDSAFLDRRVKGDLDRTGSVDLLFRNANTSEHLAWLMNGTARASESAVSPTPAMDQLLAGTDDVNRDGSTDLIFRRQGSTGATEVWYMTGTLRTGGPASILNPPNTDWTLAATGDFDRNGYPDLLWRNTVTQKLSLWTMQGTTHQLTIVPSPDAAVNANWSVVATLDFDGDGTLDILWYNSSSGNIVQWLMDANVVRTAGRFTTPPGAGNNNWKVVAAGDYGVGAGGAPDTNDLVWRNQSSGKLVVWHLDWSGTRTSGVFTAPDSPADPLTWSVVGPK